ncbi:MAG: outer membrane beta-barrel protein [Bacteroidales bacterium]|nr:outer membrane beta-barrel protein [Bacteroidales bacterium]
MYKENKKFNNKSGKLFRLISSLMILLLMISGNNVYADKNYGVSGQVKDEKTNEAIEFCSVRIFNMKDSLITGAVTDSKGFFTTSLSKGNYCLLIEYLGYETDTTEISVKKGNEFLGIFKLKPDDDLIAEVTINGTTKENLLDKDVFLVTEDMRIGAADTKDVLSKVKGVDYDRYNNSIKVDGEDNIIILVNGLEKDQEYIKNLAPDRLKKIEVIRDPSGRYALEGYSAVINVILKQNYKGTELHFSDQCLIDTDNKNAEYLFPVNSFSVTLNYTYNKVNLYSKVSNNYLNIDLLSSGNKVYDSGLSISKEPKDDMPNLQVNNFRDNFTLGADYYVNPKHTVSFESNFRGLIFRDNINVSKYNVLYTQDGNEIDNFDIENKNKSESKSNYHSLFYVGKLNKNNSLNIDFTYSNYYDKYSNEYFENALIERKESGTNDKVYTKFYSEFNHTVSKKANVQIGYGNTMKKLVNTFNPDDIDFELPPEDVNDFEYTDIRHKFYAYYSWNLNDKLGFKLGGAAETSSPEAYDLKTNYFIYQPYADIKYKPLKVLDIRLKYRSSSDYPTIDQANPFTYVIDQESVKTGNPYLSPAVIHKASIKLNIMTGLASIEPYYHFSNNYITQIGTLRDDGIFEYAYDNAGEYNHSGIKGSLTIPFGKSLFLQSNADFYKSSIEYEGSLNELNDWTMNSQLIYVNQKHGTVAGLIYQNNLKKVITAQGYKMWNNDFWALLVQQPFFKKKLNVMFLYILPLNIGADYEQGSYIETSTYNERKIEDLNILKNIFMVQISYRINKGKSIRKTEKDIEQEEEKTSKSLF